MPIMALDDLRDARPGVRLSVRTCREALGGGEPKRTWRAALSDVFRLVSGYAAHGLQAGREPLPTSSTGISSVPIALQGLGSTHLADVAAALDEAFRDAYPETTVRDAAKRFNGVVSHAYGIALRRQVETEQRSVAAHAYGNNAAAEPSAEDRSAAALFLERLEKALG